MLCISSFDPSPSCRPSDCPPPASIFSFQTTFQHTCTLFPPQNIRPSALHKEKPALQTIMPLLLPSCCPLSLGKQNIPSFPVTFSRAYLHARQSPMNVIAFLWSCCCLLLRLIPFPHYWELPGRPEGVLVRKTENLWTLPLSVLPFNIAQKCISNLADRWKSKRERGN